MKFSDFLAGLDVKPGYLLLALLPLTMLMASDYSRADFFSDEIRKCRPMVSNPSGRYDYRDPSYKARRYLEQVEGAHFTASVRQGIAGNTGALAADLNYVLERFPNHHQALYVMSRHQRSSDFNPNVGGRRDYQWPTMECYFNYAMTYSPDDAVVFHIAGIHYHKLEMYDLAEDFYLKSIQLEPENAEVNYNVGLFYLDRNKPEEAAEYAKTAYSRGYKLPGLRDNLKDLGYTISLEAPDTSTSDPAAAPDIQDQ